MILAATNTHMLYYHNADQWLLKDKCLSMVNESLIFAGAAGRRGQEIDKDRHRREVNVPSSRENMKPCLLIAAVAS